LVPNPPTVRFGDGTSCRYAPTVLEELGALVVYAGKAGRGYGDDQSLERRKGEADEKATAVRADLQRMLRDAQATLSSTTQPSAWPEVREHARKASGELQTMVERWQEQANDSAERTRRNLVQYQRDIADSMRADLFAYLRVCLHANAAKATLVRRLGPQRYIDAIRFDAASELRVDLDVDTTHCDPPQRLRALMKRVVLQAGTKKRLFGGEKPRDVRLDPYYIVEAVLSPSAIDLRLAPKLKATPDVVLLRLRPEGEHIHAQLTIGDAPRQDASGEDTLAQLWDRLQQLRLEAVLRPSTVSKASLDGQAAAETPEFFACAERLVDRWRPIVTELCRHTPGPDELCIVVPGEQGLDDELWVRTADLTQHLLTIPTAVRARLSPHELLGPAEVTRESDIIDLGNVMVPDAGQDSDVISLHYIPPDQAASSSASTSASEAGAPSPVFELATGDISELDISRDPEENSGCYDLSKLGRTVAK
jgi:hypothetical protein